MVDEVDLPCPAARQIWSLWPSTILAASEELPAFTVVVVEPDGLTQYTLQVY